MFACLPSSNFQRNSFFSAKHFQLRNMSHLWRTIKSSISALRYSEDQYGKAFIIAADTGDLDKMLEHIGIYNYTLHHVIIYDVLPPTIMMIFVIIYITNKTNQEHVAYHTKMNMVNVHYIEHHVVVMQQQ